MSSAPTANTQAGRPSQTSPQLRKRSRSTSGASGEAAQKRQILETGLDSASKLDSTSNQTDVNVGMASNATALTSGPPEVIDEANPNPTATVPVPLTPSTKTAPNGVENHHANNNGSTNSLPPANESAPAPVPHDPTVHPDPQAHSQMVQQQQGTSSQPQQAASHPAATQTIQMRALIVTQDASIIIGKGGRHINEVREKSGARATISEAVPGNAERILSVAGPLDAVSKAFGLIVRRINDEPFDVPSVPGSRAVTIRFIVPNSKMGSVIGKAGSKIKEIQDMSGARVQASEALLPGSTERVLSISGVADAVHIAVYYVGMILVENQERMPANTTYRPGGGGGGAGHLGHSAHGAQLGHHHMGGRGPPAGVGAAAGGYGPYGPGAIAPHHHHHPHHSHPHPHHPTPPAANPGGAAGFPNSVHQPGSQTQQIYIPNGFVGAVIGKGGQKINEIRQASATHIKIMEPGEGGQDSSANERLVTITGQPMNIQMAVSLLYRRLEAEKQKFENPGMATGL